MQACYACWASPCMAWGAGADQRLFSGYILAVVRSQPHHQEGNKDINKY